MKKLNKRLYEVRVVTNLAAIRGGAGGAGMYEREPQLPEAPPVGGGGSSSSSSSSASTLKATGK